MPSVLALIISIAIFHSGASLGAHCENQLSSPITLPRELKLSQGAAEYLLQTKKHGDLLRSLSRIFSVLNDSAVNWNQIGEELAEEPGMDYADNSPLLLDMNPFLQPGFLSKIVEFNYVTLSRALSGSLLEPIEISLLSYFLRDIPKTPRSQVIWNRVGDSKNSQFLFNQNMQRMKLLLSRQESKKAVVRLLSIPEGRAHFIKVWSKLPGAPPLSARILDETISRILRGESSPEIFFITKSYLESFVKEIGKYGLGIGLNPVGVENSDLWYERRDFLEALDHYFANKLQVKLHLDHLTKTMDYFVFGTPFPFTRERIQQLVLEESKILLLPLKAEYSFYKTEAQKHLSFNGSAVPAAKNPFRLKMVDHFEPKAFPYVPGRQNVSRSLSERSNLEKDLKDADRFEAQIYPGDSLRSYTSFIPNPFSLKDLLPRKTYSFWFLRDDQPTQQSLQFSESVIHWLSSRPDFARPFLNALHLGRARVWGQSGLKLLNKKSSHFDDPIFELKIHGPYRGLLLLVNGQWQFIAIVSKAEVKRAIDNLTPL